MASKPWAGEIWIGGVLLAGGLAITTISLDDGGGAIVRTAALGVLIMLAGVATIVHARRAVHAIRCAQCTNLLGEQSVWMRCTLCDAALHVNCSDVHTDVYHHERGPGAGPYRTPK